MVKIKNIHVLYDKALFDYFPIKLKVEINVKYNESEVINTHDIVQDFLNWSLFNDEAKMNYNITFNEQNNNFNASELEKKFL